MGTEDRYRGRLEERYGERKGDWTAQIEVRDKNLSFPDKRGAAPAF